MTQEKPKRIELTIEEVEALVERIRQESLFKPDYGLLVAIVINYFTLDQAHQEQSHTLSRMVNQIFGHRTEKAKDVLREADTLLPTETASPNGTSKGHGRNGASAYEGVQRVCVPHACYKTGDRCPLCLKGKLYPFGEPGVEIRVVGRAPLDGTVYELERLRCNLCGKLFTAQVPDGAGNDKYDETAGAMVALLKYGAGLPFYRMEKLQESLGVPLAASTQWEIVERTADQIHPVYRELMREAAQSDLFYHDDTLMKILANLKEIETEDERVR
jgi:transposase